MRCLLACICVLAALTNALAQESQDYRVGVGRIDITPDYPVRLSGFGFRRTESEGVTQKIWARALVIADPKPAALLAVEAIGIPQHLRDTLAKRLAAKIGLRPERLAICATHTHTAPMIGGNLTTLFGVPVPADHQQRIDRYTRELTDKLEAVVLAALEDAKPAKLSFGIGTARFANNRRTQGGPVDHDLPLLVVKSPEGTLRAVFVNYACHCTTLSFNRITGDWAGYAAEYIESNHPGAAALIAIGCGADANPLRGVTRDRVDLAQGHGREISVEVERLLGGFLKPLSGNLTAKWDAFPLPLDTLPNKEEWEIRSKQKDAVGYHAQMQLDRLQRGEKLKNKVDYAVQTWAFGDSLAMVFLPGEVVVDYALRLKKELDPHRIWLNAYANDVPCYIPSERILKEGGYEGGGAMTYYDLPARLKPGVEQIIVDAVHRQLGAVFKPAFDPNKLGGTKPLSPQQSMATFQSSFHVELAVAEPLVTSPVAIDWGPDGRLYVAEMVDYPQGLDGKFQPGGRIRMLRSSLGNYQYDRATVFLDNIPFPTGVSAYRKGILVCAAPDILYAEDTDGDGRADVVRKLYTGFGTENYQARVNSIQFGLDHWWYGSCGLYGGTIRNEHGKQFTLGHRDFRIRPDEGLLEPATGRTQQGRCRDDWGNWFGCDNSTLGWHYPLPDHYLRRNPHLAAPPAAVPLVPAGNAQILFPAAKNLQLFTLSGPSGRATAVCGMEVYRDELLGKEFTGNIFLCEPVNLLIHRRVLQPRQSSFVGTRARQEQDREFLAATDPWFRPVQVRTGPDGALWVVDMYRYVIEHPIWIPPEERVKHDLRAGSTMGRIYRIYPNDKKPRPLLRMDRLDTAGLVAALDSPNGWQRDMASQMLLWKKDDAAVPLLKTLAKHIRPETRLHVLSLLEGMGKLQPEDVEKALRDPHPGVRRHALRLSEPFLIALPEPNSNEHRILVGALLPHMNDPDAQVRLQLAFSLGAAKKMNGIALGEMCLEHQKDPYFIAALFSSIHESNLFGIAFAVFDKVEALPDYVARPLYSIAVGLQDSDLIRLILTQLAHPRHGNKQWQLKELGEFLDVLDRSKLGLKVMDKRAADFVLPFLAHARQLALTEATPLEVRLAAMRLLGRIPDHAREDLAALEKLLVPQTPDAVQAAAMTVLARLKTDESAILLVSRWMQFSPALKTLALDLLLSRERTQWTLLDGMESKRIPPQMIDASRRHRMLQHPNPEFRKAAAKVFALGGSREQVLKEHQSVLAHPGDRGRGKAVFQKNCANCHRFEGFGHAVGPDLASIGNRTAPYLLAEILDPNRTIDNRYVEYAILTKTGLLHNGLLVSESSTSITLRGQEGKEQIVLRTDLDQLRSTGKSLMPEGLEKDIIKENMADLLAYLAVNPATATATQEDPELLARELLDDKVSGERKNAILQKNLDRAAELVTAMTQNLKQDAKEEYRRIPWIWRVAIAASRKNQTDTLRKLMLVSLPKPGEPLRDWQAVVIGGGIINGISLNGDWPHRRIPDLFHLNPPALAQYHRALDLAAAMADDEKVPTGTRYDALRMIALDSWTKCGPQLHKYLAKGVHDELQMGAISGLSDVDDLAVPGLLLGGMGHYSAPNRKLALEALLRTEARIRALLDALEQDRVKKEWLDAGLQKKLRELPNVKQREQAIKLLQTR